ncbi:DsbC family protein [Parahaliea mediterranea]|uniref:Thiol:disulfide interchange protein n=1 Tax=Parahaliea mediterranea TaxID=651086 RepID=A0A939DD56_9GAMM|nr:DsbC family protein [Parahaliea mediterranea]MBN7796043.1 DsbC family protein [Parahaliea mediterranea]
MTLKHLFTLPALALCLAAALARAGEPVDKSVIDKLRSAMEVPSVGLKIDTVSTSEMPGMYEVQFKDGPLVYATADGSYFVVGDLFSVGPKGYVNLAEQRRDKMRLERLAGVENKDMIVFAAEGETRGHITVFTDVTCFYCQKLHKEVPELNKRGVEVRYLAYPRAGLGSPGFRQLASAWCADDPQGALTRLKNRENVPEKVCPGNPVARQYKLGQEMGVRGTPAIVTESGQMIPGYQSADELMVSLGLE